jgi:tetratricopeptide (TPR) repeat protein
LGLVYAEITEDDEAERQLRLCRDVADQLGRAGPFDPLAEDIYCQAGVALADLYLHRRRLPEAIDCLRQTAGRAEAWRAAAPGSPEARERLAECYTNLAAAYAQAGDFREVEPWTNRLLTLATKWEEDDPKSDLAHYFRYMAEEYRGRLCQADGDPAAALESFRRAEAILKPLRAADPASRRYAAGELYLGKCFTSVLVQLGRPAQALPYARGAADYFRAARASEYNDPDNFEFQMECADAFATHGRVLLRLLHFEDAAEQYAAALDVLRPLADKAKSEGARDRVRQSRQQAENFAAHIRAVVRAVEDPSSALGAPAPTRQDLLLVRVCVLLNQGRAEDAVKAADLVDGLRWDGPDEYLSLARTYAVLIDVIAAEKEPEHITDAEKAMRRRFADRAFDALNRACDGGFRDAAALKADLGLVSLHGDPRFPTLVERLERPR